MNMENSSQNVDLFQPNLQHIYLYGRLKKQMIIGELNILSVIYSLVILLVQLEQEIIYFILF